MYDDPYAPEQQQQFGLRNSQPGQSPFSPQQTQSVAPQQTNTNLPFAPVQVQNVNNGQAQQQDANQLGGLLGDEASRLAQLAQQGKSQGSGSGGGGGGIIGAIGSLFG